MCELIQNCQVANEDPIDMELQGRGGPIICVRMLKKKVMTSGAMVEEFAINE